MRSRNTPGSDLLLGLGDQRPNPSGVSVRLLRVWIPPESAGNAEKQKCREVQGNQAGSHGRQTDRLCGTGHMHAPLRLQTPACPIGHFCCCVFNRTSQIVNRTRKAGSTWAARVPHAGV